MSFALKQRLRLLHCTEAGLILPLDNCEKDVALKNWSQSMRRCCPKLKDLMYTIISYQREKEILQKWKQLLQSMIL